MWFVRIDDINIGDEKRYFNSFLWVVVLVFVYLVVVIVLENVIII